MSLIYQSAVGIVMSIATSYDISGYSAVSLIIIKPDGVKLTKTPTVTSPTLGTLSYTTVTGDLDVVGQYSIQAIVTYASGAILKGEIDSFTVFTPL
jgi:uncharacterized protein YfaS (alpha-2-macroglobulin family)